MATMAERILDTAQALAQVRGYNGFSYADISAELAITKPSIHYHVPSKADLAEAIRGIPPGDRREDHRGGAGFDRAGHDLRRCLPVLEVRRRLPRRPR